MRLETKEQSADPRSGRHRAAPALIRSNLFIPLNLLLPCPSAQERWLSVSRTGKQADTEREGRRVKTWKRAGKHPEERTTPARVR